MIPKRKAKKQQDEFNNINKVNNVNNPNEFQDPYKRPDVPNPSISNNPLPPINPRRRPRQLGPTSINNMNNQQNVNIDQENGAQEDGIQDVEKLKLIKRLKLRHDMRGAVNLKNLEDDDLAIERLELYDNKEINIEPPKIKEKISDDNIESYIESIHHDKFFKIETEKQHTDDKIIGSLQQEDKLEPQAKTKKEDNEPEGKKTQRKKRKKRQLTINEKRMLAEKRQYKQFSNQLSQILDKTTSTVTLIFLFTEGILAGMGVLHIILIFSYKEEDYESFIKNLGSMIIIKFCIFHTLTFSSLVGNGIKFISLYQNYSMINKQIGNMTKYLTIRKNMILSGILLGCFILTFALEIYLTTHIQHINFEKCKEPGYENDYTEDEFKKFKYVHLIVDFLIIILFCFGIVGLNLNEDENKVTSNGQNKGSNDDIYDEELISINV